MRANPAAMPPQPQASTLQFTPLQRVRVFMDCIKAEVNYDTTALEGLTVEDASPGRIVCRMTVAKAHTNRFNTMHGGCIGEPRSARVPRVSSEQQPPPPNMHAPRSNNVTCPRCCSYSGRRHRQRGAGDPVRPQRCFANHHHKLPGAHAPGKGARVVVPHASLPSCVDTARSAPLAFAGARPRCSDAHCVHTTPIGPQELEIESTVVKVTRVACVRALCWAQRAAVWRPLLHCTQHSSMSPVASLLKIPKPSALRHADWQADWHSRSDAARGRRCDRHWHTHQVNGRERASVNSSAAPKPPTRLLD